MSVPASSSLGRGAAFLLAMFLLMASPATSTVIDGKTPASSVPGTASGAWVDGYGEPISSSFSVNYLVLGNETKTSAPLLFKDVPYTTVSGTRYFAFVYDSQETSPARRVSIDNVTITVSSQIIWSSTEAIILNSGATSDNTLTPLGNGADFALYVPVALFDNRGLTGNSTFLFSATQSDSHNGNDEWILTDGGVVGTVMKFSATESISSELTSGGGGGGTEGNQPPVLTPEPGTVGFLSLGLVGLFLSKRRSARS